jgi:predicted nucleic acid binding AN1-type Zn finger protein
MSEAMCVKCHSFFGDPAKLNFCSVCYKYSSSEVREHLKTEKLSSEIANLQVPEIPAAPIAKQVDHSRCFACRKKVGLLGNRCKACDCSYCNGHRLPEEHKCEGNFQELAKVEIKKNNPNITAPKIEKI